MAEHKKEVLFKIVTKNEEKCLALVEKIAVEF